MSFLDLLLAEAISAGLARQAAAREPPPENFFVLPRDPRAWRMFQAASEKETMVAAIEITNNMTPNCRAVQPLFIELARKFSSVPFLRVEIGLGRTYDEVSCCRTATRTVYACSVSLLQLRRNLGGVEYTPTILVVLFEEERKKIAKIEGVDKIRGAIRSGAADALITAFMEQRVKLRMAERLAEQMALRLALGMAMANAAGGASAAAARRRREDELKERFERDMERQIQERARQQRSAAGQQQRGKEDDDDDDKGDRDAAVRSTIRRYSC